MSVRVRPFLSLTAAPGTVHGLLIDAGTAGSVAAAGPVVNAGVDCIEQVVAGKGVNNFKFELQAYLTAADVTAWVMPPLFQLDNSASNNGTLDLTDLKRLADAEGGQFSVSYGSKLGTKTVSFDPPKGGGVPTPTAQQLKLALESIPGFATAITSVTGTGTKADPWTVTLNPAAAATVEGYRLSGRFLQFGISNANVYTSKVTVAANSLALGPHFSSFTPATRPKLKEILGSKAFDYIFMPNPAVADQTYELPLNKGADGDATIRGNTGIDVIESGAGNDTLKGGGGEINESVFAAGARGAVPGVGQKVSVRTGVDDWLFGTEGNDTLIGTCRTASCWDWRNSPA